MRKQKKKSQHSARYNDLAKSHSKSELLDPVSAIEKVQQSATAKFTETVDLAVRLGIDPRKSDQNVRGLTTLPHGTGKSKKLSIAVLAKGDLAKEAEEAGAEFVGADDLIAKIQGGFKDFDVILSTEEMAPQIGKIGKALGTKTPNKKNGTVTNNVGAAIKEIKGATRVEYRVERAGAIVHLPVGNVKYSKEQLEENLKAALGAIFRAKPSTAKGKYLVSITLSSTMGPGVRIDPNLVPKFVE